MITPRNIYPEKSLYAIGAAVVFVLKKNKTQEADPELIYKDFSSTYPIKISYSYFTYSLDWLFLLGLIDLSEDKTKIKKCF